MPNKLDLTGQRYGRLVVIEPAPGKNKKTYWKCRCDCGNIHFASTHALRGRTVQSCGCLKIEKAKIEGLKKRTHGMQNTPEYHTWNAIKNRCNNIKNRCFENYGGRGIKMCDRWIDSFENFYNDMGPRPTKNHSIDRIDNDGDYKPENCRWATSKQQANNKSNNVVVKINGIEKTFAQWCRIFEISYHDAYRRLAIGWSAQKAITTPKKSNLRFITFNGETKSVGAWAESINIRKATLLKRIYDGWNIHKALTTPVKRRRRK